MYRRVIGRQDLAVDPTITGRGWGRVASERDCQPDRWAARGQLECLAN